MRALIQSALICVVISTLACDGGDYTRLTQSPTPLPSPSSVPPPSPVVPVSEISVGDVVHAQVTLDDPICDPTGWDANAPCKRFKVVPARDGTLRAMMKPAVPAEKSSLLDLLVSCPGAPEAYSGGGLEQRVSVPVLAGTSCLITVNYYAYLYGTVSADFELRTDM